MHGRVEVIMDQWILYDGECAVCTRGIGFWRQTMARRGFRTAPLQEEWVAARLKMPRAEVVREFRVLTSDGRMLIGAEGYRHLMRAIWWAWPVAMLLGLPGLRQLFEAAYRFLRDRRYCVAGRCDIGRKVTAANSPAAVGCVTWHLGNYRWYAAFCRPARETWTATAVSWMPVAILPAVAIAFRKHLEPWQLMWLIAFGFYAGFKWLTLLRADRRRLAPCRSVAYLFFWPGMNAQEFLHGRALYAPRVTEWLAAAFKFIVGIGLVWGLARMFVEHSPVLAAWIAGAGYILMLHCGLFHLIALFWQRMGFDARPVMNSPLRALSLAELWGTRWNTAFSDLGKELVIRPLSPRIGAGAAMLLTFLISGLMHELLIALPVNAGWGLPTLYFMLQGVVIALQRTRLRRRWQSASVLMRWMFVALVAAGPAYWLFHPAFMQGVFVPFLRAIRALGCM
jgi:predicted DCC family thiol-disulfide oxidoreductase YuxK